MHLINMIRYKSARDFACDLMLGFGVSSDEIDAFVRASAPSMLLPTNPSTDDFSKAIDEMHALAFKMVRGEK